MPEESVPEQESYTTYFMNFFVHDTYMLSDG